MCACLHNFLEKLGGNDVLPYSIADIEAEEKVEEEELRVRALAQAALAEATGEEKVEEAAIAHHEALNSLLYRAPANAKSARQSRLNMLVGKVTGGGVTLNPNVNGEIDDYPSPQSLRGSS